MDLYHIALYAHILGAVVIVGMGFFMPILMRGLRRTPTVTGLREWADAIHRVAALGNPAAALVLITGLYMAWSRFSFADGWLAVSLVLFLIAGGIAGGVLDPQIKALIAAADAAPEGPVPDDLRAVAAAPKMHNFEAVLFGLDLAIVFLMTNKPPLAASLMVAAAGLAVGALRITVSHRRSASPAVAA